jgi:hypothetical protein
VQNAVRFSLSPRRHHSRRRTHIIRINHTYSQGRSRLPFNNTHSRAPPEAHDLTPTLTQLNRETKNDNNKKTKNRTHQTEQEPFTTDDTLHHALDPHPA